MTEYRIMIEDNCGRLTGGSKITCASDQEACSRTKILLAIGERAKIWDRDRCVDRVFARWSPRLKSLIRSI
jgi:hypothetical protein